MKSPFPSWSRLIRAVHLPIARLFIRQCLLFRSKEKINWVLGGIAWISFIMLIYAVYNLVMMDKGHH